MNLQIIYFTLEEAIKALEDFHKKENPLNAMNITVSINMPNVNIKGYTKARQVLKGMEYCDDMHDRMIIDAKIYSNKIEAIKYVYNKYDMTLCNAKVLIGAILDEEEKS